VFTPQKDENNEGGLSNSMLSLDMGGGGGDFSFSSPKFGSDTNVFGSPKKTAEKIDWSGDPQPISSEWGKSSTPIQGDDEEENLSICEHIKEAAEEELDDEKLAFVSMSATDRTNQTGNALKKLVRKFLKVEMGDSYDSKLKKTYTARLLNEADEDAEVQWRFMKDKTFRENALRKYMQLVSESPAFKGSDSKKEVCNDTISSPQTPSKEKEKDLSFSKPAFGLSGDTSKPAFSLDSSETTNFDNLGSSTTNSWGGGGFDTSAWGSGGDGNFGGTTTTEWGNTTTTTDETNGFSMYASTGNQQSFASLAFKSSEDTNKNVTKNEEETNTTTPTKTTTFSIEGKRGHFKESHAKNAVQEHGDQVQKTCGKVILSTQSVTEPGARVLATYLSGMKHVVTAELADMISGIPEKEALKSLELVCNALSNVKTLRKVNLSDNALGAKGIHACSSILKKNRNTLTELYLENNGLSAEACRDIADIFLQGNSNSSLNLKVLHFYNNMSGDGGGEHVARLVKQCPNLEDFRLASTRCLEKGGTALGKALGFCTKLKDLDLSDNAFNLEGAKAVASSIQNMSKLRVLNLADLSLTCEGTIEVCRAIRGQDAIEELYLSFNEAGEDGALEIAKTIETLPKLRVLNLECNEFGDDGISTLCSSLSRCENLESLNLKSNEIGNVGARKLLNALPKSLKCLQLDENEMSDKMIKKMKFSLKSIEFTCEDCMGDEDEEDEEDDPDYVPEDEEDDEEEEVEEENTQDEKPQWDAAALKAMLPPSDSWKCEVCLVPNNSDLVKCRSCGSNKPGTENTNEGPTFGSGMLSSNSTGGLTFGTTSSTSTGGLTFGTTTTTSTGGLSFGTTDNNNGSLSLDTPSFDTTTTTTTKTFDFNKTVSSKSSSSTTTTPNLLIDTDVGCDDALALLMAFSASSEGTCTIDSITTVFGNVSAKQSAENVEKLLYLHGKTFGCLENKSIPIAVGSEVSMIDFTDPPPQWPGHGPEGMGDASIESPPASFQNRTDSNAAMHIIERCQKRPGEITIVCLGPLTNLALALRLEPSLNKLVKKVVVMGGTSKAHGNTTAVSEFNIYCDPEAAHVVFKAFDSSQLVVVNWEEVLDASYSWSEFQTLTKESSFRNNFLGDLFGAYKRVAASKAAHSDDISFCPADAYTMAVALKPDQVIEKSVSLRAFVELHGRCRGLTVYDWSGRMRKGETFPATSKNVTVVEKLNKKSCWDLFRRAVC